MRRILGIIEHCEVRFWMERCSFLCTKCEIKFAYCLATFVYDVATTLSGIASIPIASWTVGWYLKQEVGAALSPNSLHLHAGKPEQNKLNLMCIPQPGRSEPQSIACICRSGVRMTMGVRANVNYSGEAIVGFYYYKI